MRWFDTKRWSLLLSILLVIGAVADSTLLSQQHRNEITKTYGSYAVARVEAALKLIRRITPLSVEVKLNEVNRFVNKVRFVSDQRAWGKRDYWATPIEFLGHDMGDCEDFVITKYIMLRRSGIPEEKLFFTYVKALRLNQAHMVLSYYKTPKSIPLVLDNLNHKVLPATKRHDLAFVYSFNAKALYLNRQRGLGKIVPGGKDKNKKWAAFLDKIEKDFL